MRYLISLPNTPATRHSVKYETSSKSFKKVQGNRTVTENSEIRLEEIMTNVLISNYLLSAESLNFPPCLYSRLSSQLCGSDTRERAPSRRVTSRHVTREATQAEREKEKGGRPKKEKAHRKTPTTWTFAGEWGDGTGGRHARLVGNTRKHSSGLVKVRSRRRSRAFTANLPRVRVLGGEGRVEGGHSRPRKHCRVINIPKHNAATLTAARRRHFRSHVSAFGDDMLGREFGARIGSCFGQKAPGRKNEEVAQVRAAKGARRQLECARCVARAHTRTRQPPADDCVHFSLRS